MREILIQVMGFAGVAFFIASYQMRSNRKLFLFQLTGCLVFIVQFSLLGAYTGALSLMVNVIRNLLLLKIEEWKWVKSKLTMVAIIALLVLVTAITWAGPLSILPLISVGVTTIGYWTNNAQKIRLSQMVGSPFTLVYDALIHSWGGALNESIALLSILISIFRFGWHNLGECQAEA
jgi:hypothetical protein